MTWIPFAIVATLELLAAAYTSLPWRLFWLWCALATYWVALAYAFNRPAWIGKRSRAAAVLLYPYLATARASARTAQRLGLEERAEVVPGLWVGGWPSRGPSPFAVLDLTAELPRRCEPVAYRNVPLLDGAPPDPDAWRAAVDQVVAWRTQGLPVLVHCAYGHGRAVMVTIGALLVMGVDPTLEAALERVRRVRPRARLIPGQGAMLRAAVTTLRAASKLS